MVRILSRSFLFLASLSLLALPHLARAQDRSLTIAPSTTDGAKPLIKLDDDDKAPAKSKEAQLAEPLKMLSQLPPQAQTDVTKEAATIKDYCTRNLMLGNFYDCGCLSLKFIKERINAGPDADFGRLIENGDYDVCVSPPAIAGYAYKRCYDVIYLEKMTDKEIDGACACVARNVARSYATKQIREMRYVDRLFSSNMLTCRPHM